MGRVQAFDTILNAAELLRDDTTLRWVFVGDGSRKDWVASEVERRGLQQSVFLLGRRPLSEMPAFYAKADVMLVSLIADDIFSLTVPAKVQSYLAAGKPVIGSIDGETARVINESGSGYTAQAGDAVALANAVIRMRDHTPDERRAMGRRGQQYCTNHFSRSACLDTIEAALQVVARSTEASE
jgi:glycosyltransferase involved in cell wall biosynthesis